MIEARKDRYYRLNLYKAVRDKGWTSEYMDQTDSLFKILTEEERELWAVAALAITQECKTEEEFLEKINFINLSDND